MAGTPFIHYAVVDLNGDVRWTGQSAGRCAVEWTAGTYYGQGLGRNDVEAKRNAIVKAQGYVNRYRLTMQMVGLSNENGKRYSALV